MKKKTRPPISSEEPLGDNGVISFNTGGFEAIKQNIDDRNLDIEKGRFKLGPDRKIILRKIFEDYRIVAQERIKEHFEQGESTSGEQIEEEKTDIMLLFRDLYIFYNSDK